MRQYLHCCHADHGQHGDQPDRGTGARAAPKRAGHVVVERIALDNSQDSAALGLVSLPAVDAFVADARVGKELLLYWCEALGTGKEERKERRSKRADERVPYMRDVKSPGLRVHGATERRRSMTMEKMQFPSRFHPPLQ